MRLSKIKLAGFKSFVDPTTITLPSNLVGVVGPNGCGKSNVIDAIRWVMGETSAKHLRGDSMEDVIFNGSSSRKPVGAASIELYFDNADGAIGGQYASYAEISIRRTVDREGTSQYFLNGTRCRRKDITHLFLGTGLGPRSYAIIEQGMVSRLVEARPEEMRTYVEEAAGISKYKDRRRETENRMHHTRENLARLNDLREEVDKQIRHLQRQAQVAEKYRALKQQERQLEAELLAIRLAELDASLSGSRVALAERQAELEAVVAAQRQLEADIERARAVHVEASEVFTQTQASYYAVQSEISRLEQALAHGRELRDRQQQDRGHAEQQLAQLDGETARDQARLRELEDALARFEPELVECRDAEAVSARELHGAEEALDAWQERWSAFNLDVKEHQHARQVEQTRLEHQQDNHERLSRQLETLVGERDSISGTNLDARMRDQLTAHGSTDQEVRQAATALEDLVRDLTSQRETEQRVSGDIEQLSRELATRRGRLETLRTVQHAALGDDEEVLAGWLRQQGLGADDRLVSRIQVQDPWSRAVETVLGDFLQALCVPRPEALVGTLPDTSLVLLDAAAAGGSRAPGTLAAQVEGAGRAAEILDTVHCASDLAEALAFRDRVPAGHSVITPEGIWLGQGWVRVSRGQRFAGLIAREQEIRELAAETEEQDGRIVALNNARANARVRIVGLEAERQAAQQRLDEANRSHMAAEAALASLRQELERARERLEAIGNDVEGLRAERAEVAAAMAGTSSRLAAADEALAALEARRDDFRREQEQLLARYNEARQRAEADRTRSAQLMVELESRRSAREAAGQALERVLAQRSQVQQRIVDLGQQIDAAAGPLQQIQGELDGQLARQVTVQQALAASRQQLEQVEQSLRADEARRHDYEKQAAARREAAEGLRMQTREFEVRRESLAERFAATGMVLEEVAVQLAAQLANQANAVADGEPGSAPSAEAWDQQLGRVRNSIERLGPINLAAIDEFAEQTERKSYLDAQHADLSAALDTLEQAIRKIDRETRTRFQETFDSINSGLQRIFPRLFGGGHAYLSLEGDDLLSAGVTVMARPPGKRNSHIHLLSGGEKALTAVALIFSIFELNPAPFCLLDEVDAPLDEANVGRFCDIVREMSKAVQFVVITHNKTTMEMTRQLMGVTMNEPGVSRLVAVDIDEAVKLAAS